MRCVKSHKIVHETPQNCLRLRLRRTSHWGAYELTLTRSQMGRGDTPPPSTSLAVTDHWRERIPIRYRCLYSSIWFGRPFRNCPQMLHTHQQNWNNYSCESETYLKWRSHLSEQSQLMGLPSSESVRITVWRWWVANMHESIVLSWLSSK